jgi:Domain of unknown function (DUF4397)
VRGRVGLLALCLYILLSIGCGSDSGGSETAQLRVLEAAAGFPSVNILVDGETVASNLGYGSATAYLTVKSGSPHVQAVPVGGGSPVFDQTLSISSSAHQTLLLTGTSSSIHAVVLTDGGTTATTGDGHVRVFNASNTMGASDAYIVNSGTSIIGVQPTTSGLAFGADTGYQLVAAGNYEVFLTVPGTNNVNLGTGPLNIAASGNQTVVAFDAAAGGFTYILFTDQ